MPYVQGSSPQGEAGSPEVLDVYHSGNVYINNVPVALWQPPGQSGVFQNDIAVVQIELDANTIAKVNASDAAFNANSTSTQYAMPSEQVTEGNIPPYDPGTPDQITTSTGVITAATASDIIPFLTQVLAESDKGMWNRTYSTTGKDNANIMGIWKSLGLANTFPHDTVPWCMGFVNFVLKQCGYKWCPEAGAAAIKNNPARWNATPIAINQGQPGDICLWKFGNSNHVNFIYSGGNGRYTFAGGNQSGKTPANNNPSGSSVTQSWPGGWTSVNNTASSQLVGIFRPSQI